MLGLGDEAAVGEAAQGLEQVGLADMQGVAELLGGLGTRYGAKVLDDACLKWIAGRNGCLGCLGVLECEVRGLARDQTQAEGRRCGCAAMFDDELAFVVVAREVERRIRPGREVAGAAELLGGMGGGRLAHVVDEQDGDVVLTLQGAQGAEHGRDVAGAVFVEAGDKPDEGVENEQSGRVMCEGPAQAVEVGGIVEAKLGDVEQEHGGEREVEAASACDAVEPGAQVGRRVLGAEEQDRPRLGHGEPSERRTAGSDCEGELGGHPGLERLGRAAEQADRRASEQLVDEPALLAGPGLDFVDAPDGKRRA